MLCYGYRLRKIKFSSQCQNTHPKSIALIKDRVHFLWLLPALLPEVFLLLLIIGVSWNPILTQEFLPGKLHVSLLCIPRGHISMSPVALIPVCLVIYGCHSCWFGVERGGWCVKEGNLTFIVPFLCSRLYAKHFTGIISCSPYKNPMK